MANATVRREAADPFHWEQEPVTIPAGGEGELVLRLVVPDGCAARRDELSVTVIDGAGLDVGKALIPRGTMIEARRHRRVEVFTDDVEIRLPITAPSTGGDVVQVELEVRHQGCKDGLCYPRVSQPHVALVRVDGG